MRRILLSVLFILIAVPCQAGWTPAERISDENTILHPRIISKGDNLHVMYSKWIGSDLPYYIRSENNGLSWSEPYMMIDTTIYSNGVFPVLEVVGNVVYALWRQSYRSINRRALAFRISVNNGITWGPITNIVTLNDEYFQKHTFCVSGDNIFVIYNYYDNELIYKFVKSTNYGQTWFEPIELFRANESGLIDMACRGDTIYFVWSGNFSSQDSWETYYLRSLDGGDTWSENQLLTEPDAIGSQHPSIAINENGNVAVCWTDGKYSPNPWNGDLFVRYIYNSGENWTQEEQITFTHWARVPRIVWRSDSIHVAWEDGRYSASDPFYMLSPNNGISWEQEQLIDNDPEASEYPDIALTDSGVHVVWTDFRMYDLGRGVYYSRLEPDVFIDEAVPWDYRTKLISYPNPFNSTTLILYSNPEGCDLNIYDITGRLIKTLCLRATRKGNIAWDATDNSGNLVATGVYFAIMSTHLGTVSTKLIFLK